MKKYYNGVEDLSGPMKPGVVEIGQVSQQDFDKARAAQDAQSAEGAMGSAASMSPDPILKGIGLGLQTADQINQARYNAALQNYMRRQQAIQGLKGTFSL